MRMNNVVLKSALSLATLAVALVPGVAFAAPLHIQPAVHAFFDKSNGDTQFKLKNSSSTPIEVRIGDRVTTVAVGQVVDLKLANGTKITTTTASATREAGHLICEVSPELSKATVNMR